MQINLWQFNLEKTMKLNYTLAILIGLTWTATARADVLRTVAFSGTAVPEPGTLLILLSALVLVSAGQTKRDRFNFSALG